MTKPDPPIRPEDIKPGDWVRFKVTTGPGSPGEDQVAIVRARRRDGGGMRLDTTRGNVWTPEVLEVRRG